MTPPPTTDHAPPTEAAITSQNKAGPSRISVSALLVPGDQPAPADTFDLWADALLFAACPELDAAQAIIHNERQRRSQHHAQDFEIDRLRQVLAEAEARRAG